MPYIGGNFAFFFTSAPQAVDMTLHGFLPSLAREDWPDRFDFFCDGRSACAIPATDAATGIYLIGMAKDENDLVVIED